MFSFIPFHQSLQRSSFSHMLVLHLKFFSSKSFFMDFDIKVAQFATQEDQQRAFQTNFSKRSGGGKRDLLLPQKNFNREAVVVACSVHMLLPPVLHSIAQKIISEIIHNNFPLYVISPTLLCVFRNKTLCVLNLPSLFLDGQSKLYFAYNLLLQVPGNQNRIVERIFLSMCNAIRIGSREM